MLRFSLISAFLLALSPQLAAADCMSMPLSAQVVTKAGAEIPNDGGILVATSYGGREPTPKHEDPVRPEWRLRGKSLVAPKIELYAPGLAVYRVTFEGSSAAELENEAHEVVATVKPTAAKLAAIPAPKVKSVVFSQTISRHSRQAATATLTADPPAGAVALVLVDAKGKATSWGGVAVGRTQMPYEHNDCAMLPNGTSAPSAGETVTMFWVMADGRRSPASKPVKVASKAIAGEP